MFHIPTHAYNTAVCWDTLRQPRKTAPQCGVSVQLTELLHLYSVRLQEVRLIGWTTVRQMGISLTGQGRIASLTLQSPYNHFSFQKIGDAEWAHRSSPSEDSPAIQFLYGRADMLATRTDG